MSVELFEAELGDTQAPVTAARAAPVLPLAGEALPSWLLRYAAPFGIAAERLLFGDAEMALARNPEWWRKPDPRLIDTIADTTGVPPERVRALTLLDWPDSGIDDAMPERFARQRFVVAKPAQQNRRMGVCPECLSEDDDPYIRRDWLVGWVGACARHRVKLVRACPQCGGKLRLPMLRAKAQMALGRCQRCLFDLARAPGHIVPDAVIDLQQLLLDQRPCGDIALAEIGMFDWPVVVALIDALLGVVWLDTRPQNRARLFARIEHDLRCAPLGAADDGADALTILAWLTQPWPRRLQLALGLLHASRVARQMQRWPHLPEAVRDQVEAVLLGALPNFVHAADRGWWRPWIDNLPQSGDELRAMAMREPLPHRRQRLMALADVRDGMPVEVAAEAADVMARTLYNWLRRGAKDGLEAALERPVWRYLTEPQARELIEWISTASPYTPRWRCDRLVNEARRRFRVEITEHVAQAMLRRYGPWPKRRRLPLKRRLTVAPVYD
ncbi:TniQ family protein [Sphingobium aquiterrae]|uniref:TniQ family protein n=1 Tax=Sphingobium aquiterrae TaxID=2038656 RepID=UPI003019D290